MAQSCFRIGSFDAVVIQYSIFAMPMPMPLGGASGFGVHFQVLVQDGPS